MQERKFPDAAHIIFFNFSYFPPSRIDKNFMQAEVVAISAAGDNFPMDRRSFKMILAQFLIKVCWNLFQAKNEQSN